LGHVISENGVLPDKITTKLIEEFPNTQTVKKLKTFLGFVSYYKRFIPIFSQLASPLHKILKRDNRYERTEEHEQAFRGLKSKMISPLILRYLDCSRKFILTTDVSNGGVGRFFLKGR
jgi:hypothetical protein